MNHAMKEAEPNNSFEDFTRVMSFNLLCGGQGERDWVPRVPLAVEIIKSNDPDLLGVQEAHPQWMQALCEGLPNYDFVGVGREGGNAGEYSAVFYKKNRYSLLDSGTFWLSDTPQYPSMGWDACCLRVFTWAKLQDKTSGKTVFHYNTHLDHIGEVAKMQGAKQIVSHICRQTGENQVILTGDLNCEPNSLTCKLIEDGGLTDCRKIAVETDFSPTFHGFEGKYEPSQNIDYILLSKPVKTVKYRIVRDKIDGKLPSDHYPIVADISE